MQSGIHYNIMTSCDRNLMKYVPIQIVSMMSSMPDADVDFYLLHRNLGAGDWAETDAVCRAFGRIRLHPVQVREPEKYDMIASDGGHWCGEAYYPLCAWQYLPETEDRVLYMDAGDILIVDDIAPYYGASFDDKMLIVTPGNQKKKKLDSGEEILLPIEEMDLVLFSDKIVDNGCLFNSGCYVINLERMRRERLTIDDYVHFAAKLRGILPMTPNQYVWCGDEGFMSAVFLGDLKMFRPEDRQNAAYNFIPFYHYNYPDIYDAEYQPAVVHFCGSTPKPWTLSYETPLPRFCSSIPYDGETAKVLDCPPIMKWCQLWYSTAYQTDRLLTRLGC